MKMFLSSLVLYLFLIPVWANSCTMVLPFPAGGSSDLYSKIIQKQNTDIVIQYKPGAFAAVATSAMQTNKDWFMLSVANMYSAGNPNKNINLELLKILFFIDSMIITNKNISFSDLLTKKVNVGVPVIGHTHHAISLAIKQKNPNLEVISFGGDVKALPALISGDIDAYVISSPIGNNWLSQFPSLNLVSDIPFNKPYMSEGVVLESLNFFGVFVHKDATPEQKQHALNCIQKSISQPGYVEEFSRIGIKPKEFNGKEKDNILNRYITSLRLVGL